MADHHTDEPRPAGRRRRQVADWGVGEEIFDRLPGPHFERRPADHPVPGGSTADGRRTIVIESADVPAAVAHDELASRDDALRARASDTALSARTHEEFSSREEALRARRAHDELWAGDEPFADDDGGAAAELAERAEAFDAAYGTTVVGPSGTAAPADGRAASAIVRGGQPGRRTVKIGGRPAEFHGPPARARQRPSRPVSERLGPRPDRVAAWAFVLGLLLILIAVATANAAVPL
jgi:hypothetical protein